MERLGTLGWFAINIILGAILATMVWGVNALFLFAIVLAPVALITLVVMTFDLGGSSDVPPSHHGRRRAH